MENQKDNLDSKDPKEYAVTAGGSLGLLAVGYRGLLAWREARKKHLAELRHGGKNEPKKD